MQAKYESFMNQFRVANKETEITHTTFGGGFNGSYNIPNDNLTPSRFLAFIEAIGGVRDQTFAHPAAASRPRAMNKISCVDDVFSKLGLKCGHMAALCA